MVTDKHPKWLKTARIWAIHISWVILVGLAIWLMYSNWQSFSNPSGVSNISQLTALILSNKANIQVISFGSFLCILGLFYVLLKIPFVKWENLKLFGFEMKRASEIQKAAIEELTYSNEVDWIRVLTLATLSSEMGFKYVDPYVVDGVFDGENAFLKILHEVHKVYKTKLNIILDYGVVTVNNGVIEESETSGLSPVLKKALFYSLWEGEAHSINEEGESIVVSPVLLNGHKKPHYLIYIRTNDYTFDRRDEAHLKGIVNIVSINTELALVSKLAEKGGIA